MWLLPDTAILSDALAGLGAAELGAFAICGAMVGAGASPGTGVCAAQPARSALPKSAPINTR
jgi:hypothetical protein